MFFTASADEAIIHCQPFDWKSLLGGPEGGRLLTGLSVGGSPARPEILI